MTQYQSRTEEILRKSEGALMKQLLFPLRYGKHGTSDTSTQEKQCGRLHLRPHDSSLTLYETVRELAIQWSLKEGINQTASLLLHFGRLLSNSENGEPDSLMRQVLQEMIAERQEQGDSHEL